MRSKMFTKVPLAWHNLTYDVKRLAIAVTGVGFAVLLMFMELGFLNALLDSTVEVVERMNAEVVMISQARFAMLAVHRFDLQRIHQARSCEGVVEAFPLYVEDSGVMRKDVERGHPIRVFAFSEDDTVLDIPQMDQFAARLNEPGAVLVDTKSQIKFGFPESAQDLDNYEGELSGRRAYLVGQFELGRDFANDGNLIMTPENFATFFPHRGTKGDPLSRVDVGLIRIAEDADPIQVRDTLRQSLPRDVILFTMDEFLERERNFWQTRTPIGAIFTVGVAIGFIVGVTICYQIIYASVADHMPEFATLKAMGYTDGYFARVVLWKAIYLSLLGFLPGAIISRILYTALAAETGLMLQFKFSVVVLVLMFTMTMCIVSGLFVIRKLKSADPAELF